MKLIERQHLRVGYVIAYTDPDTGQHAYGTILHLGLGPTTRQALWVRCRDARHNSKVERIALAEVKGVIADALP